MKNLIISQKLGGGASLGFTLAEVLITLGVIGVVAAMTMPSLMAKHHQKQMEAQFKKAYSSLQQALYSIDPDMYATLSSNAGNTNTEFFADLYSKYKVTSDKNVSKMYYVNKKWDIKTYTKKAGSYNQCAQLPSRINADGSAIGGMYNCFGNWIVIDTNGPKAKPNAMGHDIFYFSLSNQGRLIPIGSKNYGHWEMRGDATYCSRSSTNAQNGAGCSHFAVENTCPDDASKTYWECLP